MKPCGDLWKLRLSCFGQQLVTVILLLLERLDNPALALRFSLSLTFIGMGLGFS